ncbi:MAG: Bor family protein [Deltaproteobacteria bacterium]|nr:Bor family protein [Deltaproteobacteria bacterium]
MERATQRAGGLSRLGLFALAVLLASTAGCNHVTYTLGPKATGEPVSGSHPYFLGGIAGSQYIKVREICPRGAAEIHLYRSFVDGLLAFLTLSIYTPRSWEIWCLGGPTGPSGPVSPLQARAAPPPGKRTAGLRP